MKMHSWLCACFITFIIPPAASLSLQAQVKVLSIMPGKTDPAIEEVHSPHLAVYDPQVQSRHRLILMIVGTGASASHTRGIDSIFATMGFHVVSVDYENNVITSGICTGSDDRCYGDYRQEIVFGTPVSSKVHVDSANSIVSRFQHLLLYLVKRDPEGSWSQFLKKGEPRWRHIIVAGHSQGSGHAAFLGKAFKVSRVLIFSGPQDYRSDLKHPAKWLSGRGATPPDRYYAFLNLKDPFNIHYQLASCDELMRRRTPDTLMVTPGKPIRGRHHILVNDIPTKNPHGSTLFPEFSNVWRYMLRGK